MKRKMKSSGRKVAADMRELRSAFAWISKRPKTAETLAFHFAEIKDELCEVARCLDSIAAKGRASNTDLELLVRHVAVHWPYHISGIKRLLLKIESERL
jgi:hypothetical protein